MAPKFWPVFNFLRGHYTQDFLRDPFPQEIKTRGS
jgi:hypothetical protein